jgi:response regulator NasT
MQSHGTRGTSVAVHLSHARIAPQMKSGSAVIREAEAESRQVLRPDDADDAAAAIERLRCEAVRPGANCANDQSKPTHEQALRILVVDQIPTRASILEEGLHEAGYKRVTVLRDMQNLMKRIVDIEPDMIFIDLEDPDRDVLEQMFQVSRCVARPVAMFVDRSDAETISEAIEAGVSAYVVDGLRKERIKSILDTAISRFNAFNRLKEELDRTRRALDERRLVDRAKGLLMKQRGISEEEAYALLRKASMNENRRVGEIAQSIITAARLFR